MALVTKDSLNRMLQDPAKRMHVIGRALVALYDRNQTTSEQAANQTMLHNNIGFTGSDGRGGSLTARYYKKHGRLEDWMVARWMKVSPRTGYPRICKYDKQLNAIAEAKAAEKSK